MRGHGLRAGEEARRIVLGEVRSRIQRGGAWKRITRDDLLGIVQRCGLQLEVPEAPKVRLWVHAWNRQAYDPPATLELDWTRYFDRSERRIASPEEWENALWPALEEARSRLAAMSEGKFIDLRGKMPLSVAAAVGAAFPQVGGYRFRVEQPTGEGIHLWRSGSTASDARFRVVAEEGRMGADLVLGICATGGALPEVKRLAGHISAAAWVYAEPDAGTGEMAVRDASDAVALAVSAKEQIRAAREKYQASRVHLVLYGPASLAVFLGQRLNAVGTVVLYERTAEGGYQPSVTIYSG